MNYCSHSSIVKHSGLRRRYERRPEHCPHFAQPRLYVYQLPTYAGLGRGLLEQQSIRSIFLSRTAIGENKLLPLLCDSF